MITNNISKINVSDIDIDVIKKDIKNIHIGVYPPAGRVRVASPLHTSDDSIRLAVVSRLAWIKKQKENFENQPRQSKREMLNAESHYFLGNRYLLEVIYRHGKHEVIKQHSTLELYVNKNTTYQNKLLVLNEWYRRELKKELEKLVSKWEKKIGIKLNRWDVKKMKTKWGACNIEAKNIWFNLELAKVPIECIEYIVVHEMVHLLERHHNDRFKELLGKYLSDWERRKKLLSNSMLGV